MSMYEDLSLDPHGTLLRDLPFMDFYVRLDADGLGAARYRSPARDYSNNWSRLLPQSFAEDSRKIALALRDNLTNPDNSFDYDGMRFRQSFQRLSNGQEWAILRRINPIVKQIEDLGLDPNLILPLRRLGMRDGLILISGATGHGKTTMGFSLLNDYMQRLGGVGITVEDPVEYLLDGPVGDYGYCYQVQVQDDDWETPLKRTLRWTPRYIFVGEVRSPRAAEQILRAATTGHLVITTIHAGSIEESLMGLLHLAEQAIGRGAGPMLAQGLTAAWHQTLTASGPMVRYVVTEENNNGDPVRALIRENKIGMINSYIDRQMARTENRRGGEPLGGKRKS